MSAIDERIEWLDGGRPLVAATLVERSGSAPFEPGATMLVDAELGVLGSVSGGCVEMALVEQAKEVHAGAGPRTLGFGISDELAGEVGLSCGGTIRVLVGALDDSSRAAMAAVLRAEREDRPAVLATRLDGPGAGARLGVEPGMSTGTLAGGPRLDRRVEREAEALLELGGWEIRELPLEERCGDRDDAAPARVHLRSHVARPKLVLFGAVDFSLALAELGAAAGFEVILCEARRAFAESIRPAAGVAVFGGWPEEFFHAHQLGPRDAVLAMTHDPKFDEPALLGALASRAGYVGALGSRRTQELRAERLRSAGAGELEINRIHGPCGLDIGAATPAETAISIVAEIIAVRADRPGGALAAGTGPIHSGTVA